MSYLNVMSFLKTETELSLKKFSSDKVYTFSPDRYPTLLAFP